jgi:hypothetical protein
MHPEDATDSVDIEHFEVCDADLGYDERSSPQSYKLALGQRL